MKRIFIFETFTVSVLFCFIPVFVFAQTELPESILWNHEAYPSFHKVDKGKTYPDFLPRFPSVEECERYGVQVNEKYLDDSLKILSLFVTSKQIPAEIKQHLIAVRDFKTNSIITIPDLMQRTTIPVREAFMTCWSTENWSWFYIDTLTSVVLLVQKNPDYNWGSDNEYSAVVRGFQPNFHEMIQDETLLEEELFQRKPVVVASTRKRIISVAEHEKRAPWGLASTATFFWDASNEIAVFRCDKLVDKKIVTNRVGRFSSEAGQEHLLAAEFEPILQSATPALSPAAIPPPASGTETEILASIAEYDRKRKAAEEQRRELIKTEAGRLKIIASIADTNLTEEEKFQTWMMLLMEVYEPNRLKNIDMSPTEFYELRKLLKSNDEYCRSTAMRLLYSSDHKVVQKIFLEEIFPVEKNIENRKYIIKALAWKGDEDCIPFLESFYSNKKNPIILRHEVWKSQNMIEAKYGLNILDTVSLSDTDSDKQEKTKVIKNKIVH
jgi:hypothetical protein